MIPLDGTVAFFPRLLLLHIVTLLCKAFFACVTVWIATAVF
jgi:hypothetical protein